MTTQDILDDFDEKWDEAWFATRKGHSCIGRVTLQAKIARYIREKLTLQEQRHKEEMKEMLEDLKKITKYEDIINQKINEL